MAIEVIKEIFTCPYNPNCRIEVFPDGRRKHQIDHPLNGDVMTTEQVWRTRDGYMIVYMSDALFDGLFHWMSGFARSQGKNVSADPESMQILRDTPQMIEYRRENLKPQYEKSEKISGSNHDLSSGNPSHN